MAAEWRNRIVGEGMVPPAELTANPENWRTHGQTQRGSLAGVIGTVGVVQRVIVNRVTGHIVDGHLRVELALEQGIPEIPVLYVELDPDEEHLVLMALDPLSAMAGTDRARLRALLESTSALHSEALTDLLKYLRNQSVSYRPNRYDPDAVPAERVPDPSLQPGAIVTLGRHRLAVGDCRDEGLLARLFGDQRAACVFTDPPYGVDYIGGQKLRRKITNDATDPADLYRDAVALGLPFVAKDAGWYIWYSNNQSEVIYRAIREGGLQLQATLVWVKSNVTYGPHKHYKSRHEPCIYAARKGSRPRWYGKSEADVWEIDRPGKSELHPTQKPIALAERAIGNSTVAGDIVFDGFGGSGTTLVACELLDRRCFMVELDPVYADVIVRRYREHGEGPITVEPPPAQ